MGGSHAETSSHDLSEPTLLTISEPVDQTGQLIAITARQSAQLRCSKYRRVPEVNLLWVRECLQLLCGHAHDFLRPKRIQLNGRETADLPRSQ